MYHAPSEPIPSHQIISYPISWSLFNHGAIGLLQSKFPSFPTRTLCELSRTEYFLGCPVLYSTVLYSFVQFCTVQYSTVQYSTVQYSTVQYSTVQYSTVQYSTVQYSTIQCQRWGFNIYWSTVQYSKVK
jgi:hypothetical protein